VKVLADTHILLWAAGDTSKLSPSALELIDDPRNELYFSPASLLEIAIKCARGYDDFKIEPDFFRRHLLAHEYMELAITGEHAVAVFQLPPLHKDPFDRLLIAQAIVEGMTLLTADAKIAKYPGPIRKV